MPRRRTGSTREASPEKMEDVSALGKRKKDRTIDEDNPRWKKRITSAMQGTKPPEQPDEIEEESGEEVEILSDADDGTPTLQEDEGSMEEEDTAPPVLGKRRREPSPENSRQKKRKKVSFSQETTPFQVSHMDEGMDAESEPELTEAEHDKAILKIDIKSVIDTLDEMSSAVSEANDILCKDDKDNVSSFNGLTQTLIAAKQLYRKLIANLNGEESLLEAATAVKHFWSESAEELSIVFPTDSITKLDIFFSEILKRLQSRLIDKFNIISISLSDLLKFCSYIEDKIPPVKDQVRAKSLALDKKISKKFKDISNHSKPKDLVHFVRKINDFHSTVPILISSMIKDLESIIKKKFPKSGEVVFDAEYVFHGLNKNKKRVYARTGTASIKITAKKYFFNNQLSQFLLTADNLVDFNVVEHFTEKYHFADTRNFISAEIGKRGIYKRVNDGLYSYTLPEYVDDETAARFRVPPLSMKEIKELANYGNTITDQVITNPSFYASYPEPGADNSQEFEPDIEVAVRGAPIPPMNLLMGVIMRDLPERDLQTAVHDTNGLVSNYFRTSPVDWVMSINMKEAPKNHYRDVYQDEGMLYSRTFQWFCTINPNMTHMGLSRAPQGSMQVKDFGEYRYNVERAFNTFIEGWLLYGSRPIYPTEVRAWKVESIAEEKGGGGNRQGHLHLLLTVSIISKEEIDSKLVNLSYSRIRNYLQHLWKNSYFHSQKVNTDTSTLLDGSQRERILAYINKGEKLSATGEIKYMSKSYK